MGPWWAWFYALLTGILNGVFLCNINHWFSCVVLCPVVCCFLPWCPLCSLRAFPCFHIALSLARACPFDIIPILRFLLECPFLLFCSVDCVFFSFVCSVVCSSLFSVLCPPSLFSVLCSLFAVLCSLFSVLCSLLSVLCSLFSALWSLLSALCSLLSALCSLFSVLCSMFSVLCSPYFF